MKIRMMRIVSRNTNVTNTVLFKPFTKYPYIEPNIPQTTSVKNGILSNEFEVVLL